MFTDTNSKSQKVEFTCKALGDDKLSMQKFEGAVGQNFIFFRKTFKDMKSRCDWNATADRPCQDLDQLRRALDGQALQEYIAKSGEYHNLKNALDSLQLHYAGADAYNINYKKLRRMEQRNNQYHVFTATVQACNVLANQDEERISDKDQLNIIIDGLVPHIQQMATLQRYKSLAEAYQAAQQAEMAYKLTAQQLKPKLIRNNWKKNNNFSKSHHNNTKLDQIKEFRRSTCQMVNHDEDHCFKLHPELKRVKRQKNGKNSQTHQNAAITSAERPAMPFKLNGQLTENCWIQHQLNHL
eukprot:NODE_833_length_3618_cov_0.950270.p1 type:complete len:297 gc:universal NODE_833_length_3618_cov_0.950270:3233-2343(-)